MDYKVMYEASEIENGMLQAQVVAAGEMLLAATGSAAERITE